MIDVLLASLTEYINLKHDHIKGQAEVEHVVNAKKRFAQSLNEYVDSRLFIHFEQRRKHMSQERLKIADSINSSMQNAATSIKSIAALNSAPTPPKDMSDHKAVEKWMKSYNDWYDNQRKKGLQFGE